MKIGITLPQIGSHVKKESIIQLALMAEEEHLDSLWVGAEGPTGCGGIVNWDQIQSISQLELFTHLFGH